MDAVRRRGLGMGAAVWLLLGAWSPTAPAQAPAGQPEPAQLEEAQVRFHRGLQLYDEDNYQAALVEFRRAYELAPVFRVLYNIAQVQYQLQDYAGALRSFERYLRDGGDRIEPARRAQVEKDIETLRARVGSLSITTNEPGAEVYVDDVLVGRAPLGAPVLVSAGARRVTARLDGFVPMTRKVDVAGGDALSLRLELVEVDPEPLPEPPPKQPSPPRPAPQPLPPAAPAPAAKGSGIPWEGWTVAGGLAAGAAVTGVLALRASDDLQDKKASPNVGSDELDSTSRRARAFALATDVLGAGALVAGGVSLYLTLERDVETERGTEGTLRVNVVPTGVGLSGSF